MTRTILFDSPFLLGFEHTRDLIERAAKAASESYPPYNVEQSENGGVRITLAVAGFSPEQLQVTVEGGQLIVAGKRDADARGEAERAFLHRGIAARSFERRFQLADYVEVKGADFEDGLLHIDLVRNLPERMKPRTITVGSGEPKQLEATA